MAFAQPRSDAVTQEPRAQVVSLVYASISHRAPNAQADSQRWQHLIDHARQRNAERGISGMLLLCEGLVLQWLQGPLPELQSLWQRVAADSRHHSVLPIAAFHATAPSLLRDMPLLVVQPTRKEFLQALADANSLQRRAASADIEGFEPADASLLTVLADQQFHFAFSRSLKLD